MDLEAARARIRERPELNAFISITADSGSGTVVAVKDLIDVKGIVTTAGGMILPREPAAEDAPVVARIRRAGCRIVGKTILNEIVYGVTRVISHIRMVRMLRATSTVACC